MSDVVISGVTGFLGSHLAKKFLSEGHNVWALIRPESRNKNTIFEESDNMHIVYASLTDKKILLETIKKADAWFHYAWGGVNRDEIDSEEVHNENIRMSIEVLNIAYELGCKVFMDAGSRVEYGVTEKVMDESIECNPINAYGKAKLKYYEAAKEITKKYGMKYCHLRFFSVYGYGDHPWSIISTLLRDLPQGKKVSLSACKHKWNFMHIDDATNAVYQLYFSVLEKNDFTDEIFNIASEDTRELRLFVEEIDRITKYKGVLEFGTFVQAKEGALSIVPNVYRLHAMIGDWKEKYSFAEGIKDVLKKQGTYIGEI